MTVFLVLGLVFVVAALVFFALWEMKEKSLYRWLSLSFLIVAVVMGILAKVNEPDCIIIDVENYSDDFVPHLIYTKQCECSDDYWLEYELIELDEPLQFLKIEK